MVEDKCDIAADMVESEDAFHDQFDRKSNFFHGGDGTNVPMGGQRIPESMTTVYTDVKPVVVQDYGEEYDRLMKYRAMLAEFKKLTGKVGPTIESVMRISQQLKDPEMKEGQKKKCEAVIKNDHVKLATIIEELQGYRKNFESGSDSDALYLNAIEEISAGAHTNYEGKEDYGDYVFLIRRHTQRAFKDHKDMLDVIKKIKKAKEAEVKAKATTIEEEKKD